MQMVRKQEVSEEGIRASLSAISKHPNDRVRLTWCDSYSTGMSALKRINNCRNEKCPGYSIVPFPIFPVTSMNVGLNWGDECYVSVFLLIPE